MSILPMQRPPAQPPALGRTQARVVWLALAAALGALTVGAIVGPGVLGMAPNPALAELLPLVAVPVVVADLAVGFFVTSKLRRNASPEAPPDGVAATQVIIGSATALSAGVVACVFSFVSGQGLLLLLVAPAAAVLLYWFPSEARWAALRPARAPADGRRNPMIRE